MQFADRYIQTAEKIIGSYDGSIPFHHFLKQFFASDKKYGSKDRKAITHACYCFYRLGKALMQETVSERIKAGIFLCNKEAGTWSGVFSAEWLHNWSDDLQQRIDFLGAGFRKEDIFPFQSQLSDELEKTGFTVSHLIQPDLFLRTRPGKAGKVIKQLSAAGVSFKQCSDNCIALPNTTKIDSLLAINTDAVVQDLSSQRIAELLPTANSPMPTAEWQVPTVKVWDCCAASGGKSILVYDNLKNIELTVSDVRPSIIQNLKKRFAEAGISQYRSFVCDLTGGGELPAGKYDLIICDAPCSGSGTWGRTPEQLSSFKEEKIAYYTGLQQKIVSAVMPCLAANGHLLYITCSVFKAENEAVVEYVQQQSSLQLVQMQYLKGYEQKADTMFAALFTASAP